MTAESLPEPRRRGRRPRVVVIGAGFGGLAATRALRDAPVDVLLVDAENHHLFQPLLYQVGTALLDPSEIAYPVRAILRRQANADFLLARVEAVDTPARRLRTSAGEVAYDWLVVAAGAVTETLGKPGVTAHAYGLKSLGEAMALRNHLLGAVERATTTGDSAEHDRLLTVAIVGGGATGVELAGAISELVALVLRRDFPHHDLGRLRIVLLEAGERLLTAFAPSLGRAAERALRRKGVEVRFGAGVEDVDGRGVRLASGERLDAGTVVWAVGVRGAPAGGLAAGERRRLGRVAVGRDLRLRGAERVFVIGDLAEVEESGRPLPQLAPVAIQQGRWVARAIAAAERGEPPPPAFHYRDKGSMATIGRNNGVAQLGRLQLTGFPGWVMWLAVHLVLLIGYRNRAVVLLSWAIDYLRYDRPVRIIARATPPPAAPEG